MDEKTLASTIPYASILAYDLSPEGTRLALFVVSSEYFQFPAPSWLILVNATNSEILKQVRFGTYPEFVQGYAPQIAFTPDGKFLVLQDQQKVAILDSTTLLRLRTIEPPAPNKFDVPAEIVVANSSYLAAISFGTGASRLSDGRWPVHTEVIDVSTGEKLAGWDDDDVPMSISPHGDFLAISNHEIPSPVMRIKILDCKSGKSVASLPTDAEVPKNYFAVITAKFLSDDDLVLTPDNSADKSGRNVAAYVDIVKFGSSQALQEIEPEEYGPTGEIAVSADQGTFVVVSRYLASKYREHPHWRIPSDTKPELLVFSKQKRQLFKLVDRTKLPELLGLRMGGLFDTSGLRISRDGSVISVVEDYGVTVLVSAVRGN
ncbi:MAG TPA: hypothetical protein VGT03_04860 [Candidatus Acidoferrales bacterium]|nr:hypothetical protein [Candidatus Acidoferrales bacterium]